MILALVIILLIIYTAALIFMNSAKDRNEN